MRTSGYSRRQFVKITSGILPIALTGLSAGNKKYKPLLSFSTLGCPDWPFEKIVDFAAKNKYDGIEFRGIQRELDLTKCPPFSNHQNIQASLKLLSEKNLKVVDLGSSAALHYPEGEKRQRNLDDAKRFIDLAHKLNCPCIRVFPNDFPKDADRNETIDLIVKGLLELGEYGRESNVSVLLESHGEVVYTADLLKIMEHSEHPNVGLVWDAYNMWSVTKESPAQVYASLKKFIRHTHIKDAKLVNSKEQYVLLGKGESPIFEAVDALAKDNYKGYYSFEWEKLWHPEIDEPEIAIADYPKAMMLHFEKSGII